MILGREWVSRCSWLSGLREKKNSVNFAQGFVLKGMPSRTAALRIHVDLSWEPADLRMSEHVIQGSHVDEGYAEERGSPDLRALKFPLLLCLLSIIQYRAAVLTSAAHHTYLERCMLSVCLFVLFLMPGSSPTPRNDDLIGLG